MISKLIIIVALLITSSAAYILWRRFTIAEVSKNASDIIADGSQDSLRAGYHSRRGWVRFWPWLGLSVGASLPLLATGWLPVGLAFLAVGTLLAGYFARYFTPMLNVARGLPEFRASSDSASWPDAAIWRKLRAEYATGSDATFLQLLANTRLERLLNRTWLLCRLAAGVLGLAAAALVIHS